MQKFGNEWPELKGIIHAAGVVDDGSYLLKIGASLKKSLHQKSKEAGICMRPL